ncbi:MAG: transcription antitermination factor NusB [Deltaproteobacteria bacterium]|nr:transcription antitermination factor NusB [Deltaproteobacteria bacterium]MBW2419945.1 transcription antitermination factor NusB [Deltaproteobacteria bacterium]
MSDEFTASSARHRAREVALQALYALDLVQSSVDRALEPAALASAVQPSVRGRKPLTKASRPPIRRAQDREAAALAASAAQPAPAPRSPQPAPTPEEVFEGVAENFEMPEGARAFALELVVEVGSRGEELDARVAEQARNWRVARMARVDRNILRLATYELIHTDTPAAVILDEAVQLARRYGGDTSPGFVNGILDAVARVVREPTP